MTRTERKTPRKAVVYCRISSDPTGQAAGVGRQRKDCADLAAREGWTVVAELTDNDISAYSGKPRPAYRRMLAMLADGEADAILAWHPDRLYRQLYDLGDLVKAVQSSSTVIRTVMAGDVDLNSASGVMNAEILASVSKHQVAHMIEQVKSAKDASVKAGTYRGGPRPFGYEADGITVREDEAQWVRYATAAVLRGESLRGIAAHLAAKGVRTVPRVPRATRTEDNPAGVPESHAWRPSELRRLLMRGRNAGLMEVTAPDGSREVTGPAVWPALVSEQDWTGVKAVLTDPSRRTPSPGNARSCLLSGIALCGVCGKPLAAGGRRVIDVPAYRCRDNHVTRTRASLDAYVEAELIEYLLRTGATDVEASNAATADDDDAPDLEAEATRLRARLAALADAFATDDDSDPLEYRTAARALKDRLTRLEAQMAELARSTHAEPEGTSLGVLEMWPQYGLDRRRDIIAARMRITVLPARRGRPKGHVAGTPVFDPAYVRIEFR